MIRRDNHMEEGAMTPEGLDETGLAMRRRVLGDAYVERNLADADAFMMAFQELVTHQVWTRAWGGTAIDLRTRALVTLGMLAALGRFDEVAVYTRASLRCGATVDEIRDVLVQVGAYCGAPAARQSFQAAHETLVADGVLPG
jgi:alkylhydroperoxidase/carboxymuconolactone decarboxylase family protein YurZ